jgi:CxxC motif-containing protein (DUF1111 family)
MGIPEKETQNRQALMYAARKHSLSQGYIAKIEKPQLQLSDLGLTHNAFY